MNIFKNPKTFEKEFKTRLDRTYMVSVEASSLRQRFNILGTLIKEYASQYAKKTQEKLANSYQKEVIYFSMEFLLGRLVTNNLINLGVYNVAKEAFQNMGIDLNEVEEYESDPGLGNGGLGRLAACFLDSLSSLGYPGYGNCLRYRYGLFRQKITNGYQEERPDNWLSDQYVWETRKEELSEEIPFYGYVSYEGKMVYHPTEFIKAVPYDVMAIGAGNGIVTNLRIWNAEPASTYPINKSAFEYEFNLEKITGFLYPDDTTDEGKRLRLTQQYFFSSAGVKSACRIIKEKYHTLKDLDKHVTFHINDTHPTLVIPELIRILLDEENMGWDEAYQIASKTCAYTNHTILSEALEKWPVYLIQNMLPRVYQIIEEINRRWVEDLRLNNPTYNESKLAIIHDGVCRMANLCVVVCFSVNGVAKLHTEILKNIEMKEFNELFPGKFNNKTNGITHRRWLYHSNKELSDILDAYVTPDWVKNPDLIKNLEKYVNDEKLHDLYFAMKKKRKEILAAKILKEQGILIDPNSIFDIQVKRLHEYKRQLLNALHIMDVYNELKTNSEFKKNYVPHTFIFGAKAASGYYFAKKIIKLISTIGEKVNNDLGTNKYLKVVFVENYNVSYAEKIMPAADISEQISTASKEASGTGNMKFMMNGALTIGTMDGANVEISELVGPNNIYIFGLNANEVAEIYKNNSYSSYEIYQNNFRVKRVVDQLINGFFESVDKNEFKEIYDKLLYADTYLVLKDFDSYLKAHAKANEDYKNKKKWAKMALINISKSYKFSSDRTIKEYANEIWHIDVIK